jgi:hypothetical protein
VKLKTLALVAAASFGLAGTNAVFACSTAAWNGGETGNPVEGRPTDATPVARYAGQCGLRSAASAQFVTDNTPAAETTFRARFYVYTGLTSGSAVVYEALNTGGAPQIGVTYNRDAGSLSFATTGSGATPPTITVVPDRWYSVELDWSRTRGNLLVAVRGAAATTDSTVTVSGVGGADQIDTARLGWISGTGVAATRGLVTDAYESRRSTAIGRLCRGDANLDGTRNSGDILQARNEFLTRLQPAPFLAAGQPDASEDGVVNTQDQLVIRNLFLDVTTRACSSGA